MMLKKITRAIATVVIAFAVCTIPLIGVVYASEGTGGGSGGDRPCNMSTTAVTRCGYGVWRWYPWPEGATSVTITGTSNDVAPGKTITGCADAGGYFRYALLVNKNSTLNGTAYSKGDQIGVGQVKQSKHWAGSGTHQVLEEGTDAGDYSRVKNWKWSDVIAAYNKWDDYPGNNLSLGISSTSDLGWFCGNEDIQTYDCTGQGTNIDLHTLSSDQLSTLKTKRDRYTQNSEDGDGRKHKINSTDVEALCPVKKYDCKGADGRIDIHTVSSEIPTLRHKGKKYLKNSTGGDNTEHNFKIGGVDENDPDKLCPVYSYTPTTSDSTCPNSSLHRGKYLGQTGGRSGVVRANATSGINDDALGSSWTLTDSALTSVTGSKEVYARPDQYVRFAHEYCYGPQGVVNVNSTQKVQITSNDNAYKTGLIGGGEKTLGLGNDPTKFGSNSGDGSVVSTEAEYAKIISKTGATASKVQSSHVGSYIRQVLSFNNLDGWTNRWTPKLTDPGCPSCSGSRTNTVNTSGASTYSAAAGFNTAGYWPGGVTPGSQAGYWTKNNYTICPYPSGSCYCSGCSAGPVYYNFEYPFSKQDNGNVTKTVSAVVPYNFDTKVTAYIGSEGGSSSVDAGESTNLNFKVGVLKRANQDVDGANTYSTHTPSYTKIQMVSFVIPSDAKIAKRSEALNSASKLEGGFKSASTYSDVCAYFESKNLAEGSTITDSIECQSVVTDDTYSNNRATINGSIPTPSAGSSISEIVRHYNDAPVPDRPGAKFCVAVGVYPGDSHNDPLADASKYSEITVGKPLGAGVNKLDTNYNGQHGQGTTNSTSPNWRISGAVCSTIAKKANAQVWGSIYTNGSIDANISKKIHSATHPNTYGSWADTSIIAKGNVTLMSSAAALGYTNVLNYPGGNGGTNAVNYCENVSGNTWKPTLGLTILTVGRINSSTGADNCSDDAISITASDVNVTDKSGSYVSLLRDRYTDTEEQKGDLTIKGWDITGDDSHSAFHNAHILREYEYESDEVIQTLVINSNSTVTIDSLTIPKNYTLIINAKSVIIKGNICYEEGTCKTQDSDTILKDRNSASFENIASLPQAIFFASEKFFIRKEVNQVDAWLVGEGYTQTCAFDTTSGDAPTETIQDSDGNDHNISTEEASDCARLLVINGPVLTSSVKLRRTGGAFSNDTGEGGVKYTTTKGIEHALDYNGSVTPAEILNLRPDAYLWSYYQAQQNSQAVGSYTRELAPRL